MRPDLTAGGWEAGADSAGGATRRRKCVVQSCKIGSARDFGTYLVHQIVPRGQPCPAPVRHPLTPGSEQRPTPTPRSVPGPILGLSQVTLT